MRYVGIFLLLVLTLEVSAQSFSEDAITGTWLTADKKGEITISKEGSLYFGKITGGSSDQKFDIHNPDEARRGDPLIGVVIIKGLKYAGNNKWENGTVYDPQTGKKYSCHITMSDRNRLKITGYIGFSFIGRSEDWERRMETP